MLALRIFLFLLVCHMANAQDTSIVFDRPGIADSPYIVGENSWQFETGFEYADYSGLGDFVLPTIMLRKALSSIDELRITFNYGVQMMSLIKRDISKGYDNIALGWKHKIWNETAYLPDASFMINTFFPIQELKHVGHSKEYNVELGFQFQNTINRRFSLNYNLGTIFSSGFNKGALNTALCLGIAGTEKLGFFVEGFCVSPFKPFGMEPGFDFGALFYPSKRTQIDVSVIDNTYRGVHYYAVLIGFSFQMTKTK